VDLYLPTGIAVQIVCKTGTALQTDAVKAPFHMFANHLFKIVVFATRVSIKKAPDWEGNGQPLWQVSRYIRRSHGITSLQFVELLFALYH
jgi:hypothetical protein